MTLSSHDTLANRLAATLDLQDVVCQHVLRTLARTGHPLAPAHLAELSQMSQKDLAAHLSAMPDIEFDQQGQIVGWGLTLVPTPHQVLFAGHTLFTWCAFDTVLGIAVLQQTAQVHSTCSATRQPISFVVTPAGGITDLLPSEACLSLILPAQHSESARGVFCVQSLFFASAQVARSWRAAHPGASCLSVAEAAAVGQAVARLWSSALRLNNGI